MALDNPLTQTANIHRRLTYMPKMIENQKKVLSPENFKLFMDFNNSMIVDSNADTTRYKNLSNFSILSKKLQKNWIDITENDLKILVTKLMTEYGSGGKETNYSAILKQSLKQIVRFAKSGSSSKPLSGELPILLFIKKRGVKSKLTREDLPTNEEIRQIVLSCADSSRDKAMFALHADAGTRISELLALRIKDFTLDQYGGILKITPEGKTGTRSVRVVKSVPYITKWLNDHPDKDNSESPLFVYTSQCDTFGNPIAYHSFNRILKKRLRQAGITRRITSHYFRHKACTDMASNLTESESRMRFGWESNSAMPSKYTHLNQDDLDAKTLEIMGVKKRINLEGESMRECTYCKISYPIETRFCDNCSRPLDVQDALDMEKESKEKTEALVYEIMRQEKAKQSRDRHTEKKFKDQEKEIELLKKALAAHTD